MKSFNKKSLVEVLHTRTKLPKRLLFQIIESLLEEIKKSLELGEELKIVRFGVFLPRQTQERIGRNLKTKKEIKIKPFKKVSFYISSYFKKELHSIKTNL
ncbi:MAG: HU family DNA-binding protein [Thermodesulfobacteriaceae bacterium]|nr:HU family DNA-binding protein [Thermodesulfobacteriaceae bacterium]MCX8041979.1 HU family DNA-binding protein [Thermodesulfobacteriaceae bacterium]MDW8136390.1 HU family DNA-binding protein [Thermodesulfobacterium sp.]